MYMLRTCKNFLSEKSLKILYYSMVHCHLVYGNQIWGCANASLITELYRKQKAAVRIISNSSYRAHTEPIFKQFNILPLPSLIEFFKLQFMQRSIIIRNCAEFNAKLKEHFLSKLSFTVNCTKAYCPACNRFLNP